MRNHRERERKKRQKADEFLASMKPSCSSFKCSFAKANFKNSLILQTRYSENGSKRKKGDGKEAFQGYEDCKMTGEKHHPCKGGLANMDVGVGGRSWM